jgi:hypothetical protein
MNPRVAIRIRANEKEMKRRSATTAMGKGHPSYACSKKSKDDDNDSSTASSINKLTKELKGMKNQFTMIDAKLDSLNEGSDMSGSNDKGDGSSFFMMESYQFAQVEPMFNPRIQAILKQLEHPVHLDLRNIWLLDCQSMTDLACNKKFLTDIKVLTNTMCVATNGGMLSSNKKDSWPGYQNRIWYSGSAITNIVALKNVKKKYRVTYYSNDKYFMVHCKLEGKPNTLFWIALL